MCIFHLLRDFYIQTFNTYDLRVLIGIIVKVCFFVVNACQQEAHLYFTIRLEGFLEEHSRTNRKHVWFFVYNLRMEIGTVLILTSLSEKCQYL